jgi:hypothetical protein
MSTKNATKSPSRIPRKSGDRVNSPRGRLSSSGKPTGATPSSWRGCIGGDFSVNIAPGEVFALRWVDLDTAGNDDAMAIDNFSLGYAVIPEPSTLTLVAAGLLSALACRRRRKGPFAP